MKSYNLPADVLEGIAENAAWYAETYCKDSPVILPQLIADGLGLTYSQNDYGKAFEGLLEFKNNRFHLYLNVRENEHLFTPRVRFSFAHELGHYIIDHHRNALKQPGVAPHGSITLVSDLITEREADYFAACLLMPTHRITKDVERRKFNFALIDEISKKYMVSITTALLRFIVLGNHPIMVVCSRNGMVVWRRFNHDFPFYTLLTGIDDKVPVNTAAGDYFNNQLKSNKTEIVFAEDWFLLTRQQDRGRKFYEHCIYYEPLNQVVSVIWED